MASIGLPPDRKITHDLHPLTRQVIPRPNIETSDVDAPIRALQYVGSYNWVDSPSPTIIVPGTSCAAVRRQRTDSDDRRLATAMA